MKLISEYFNWLDDLKEKAVDRKTNLSIGKLITLLKALDEKKIFEDNAFRILKRLEKLRIKVEVRPGRARYLMNFCYSDIVLISSKYYKLSMKGFYLNQWRGYCIGLGSFIGILIYYFSKNAAFIAIGPAIGIPLGIGIGKIQDKKAEREQRVLNI